MTYRADAEFERKGVRYAVELDTGSVALVEAMRRLNVYESFAGVVLWVTSNERRINHLRESCPENVLFTLIGQNALEEVWIDKLGNRRNL